MHQKSLFYICLHSNCTVVFGKNVNKLGDVKVLFIFLPNATIHAHCVNKNIETHEQDQDFRLQTL